MTATKWTSAWLLALTTIACRGAQDESPIVARAPAPLPTIAPDASENAAPLPSLKPLLGVLDPGHLTNPFKPAPTELARETAPINAPFQGAIHATATATTMYPGQTRILDFYLDVTARNDVAASIQTIRVSGFEGVVVGIERTFGAFRAPTLIEDAIGTLILPVTIAEVVMARPDDGPLALDIEKGYTGLAHLRVHVPDDALPRRYAGTIEINGNFRAKSFPLELTVGRFEDQWRDVMAKLDAPEASLPITKELARSRARGERSLTIAVDAIADGWVSGHTWRRWVPAGSGIWDLGSLEWLGPITTLTPDERVIAGAREAPELFVVNGPSVDVISVRERRTIARLVAPGHPALGDLRVSPDGTRVLAKCSDAICLFTRSENDWRLRVIGDACAAPKSCEWNETNPEIHDLFVGVGDGTPFTWKTLRHYDLTRQSPSLAVTLEEPCDELGFAKHVYSPKHGIVACPQIDPKTWEVLALQVVRTSDLSITKSRVAALAPETMRIDDATGDVQIVGRGGGGTGHLVCIAFAPKTGTSKTCPLDIEPPRIEGTKIRFETSIDNVDYSR